VCILNSESSNIFENVTSSEYKQLLDLIQHNILSTDIQHHLRIMKDAEAMVAGKLKFALALGSGACGRRWR